MNRWNVVNAVLFQVAWFACVLGGAQGNALWGLAAVSLLLTHSVLLGNIQRDLLLAGGAASVGFVVDTVWIRSGVLNYAGAAVAPVWIVLLWVAVGLTLNHCLSMFKSRPWLGGLLAGLGAPLSYLGGERLGAVSIDEPLQLLWIAPVWLLLFAAAFTLARHSAVSYPPLPRSSRRETGL